MGWGGVGCDNVHPLQAGGQGLYNESMSLS